MRGFAKSAVISGFLFLALAIGASRPAVASNDCYTVRYHLSLAEGALREADVYLDEGKSEESNINAEVARHELDMTDHAGDVVKCLSEHDFQGYIALKLRSSVYRASAPDIPLEILVSLYNGAKSDVKNMDNEARAANPAAYREMKQAVSALHSLVITAKQLSAEQKKQEAEEKAVGDRNKAELARGDLVAIALGACRLYKTIQSAKEPGILINNVATFDAIVTIDENGKAVGVDVSRAIDFLGNQIQDVSRISDAILSAKYSPEADYDAPEKCHTVASKIVFHDGSSQSYRAEMVAPQSTPRLVALNTQEYLQDNAHIFSLSETENLKNQLGLVFTKTARQIFVITIASLNGETWKQAVADRFEGTDLNGFVVLLALRDHVGGIMPSNKAWEHSSCTENDLNGIWKFLKKGFYGKKFEVVSGTVQKIEAQCLQVSALQEGT